MVAEIEVLEWFKIFYSRQCLLASVSDDNKPRWKTVFHNQSLSPQELYKHWKDPNCLIGTRFWKETQYLLLDIDNDSAYHPYQNEEKFRAILRALENIGLCRCLIVRSSDSCGLHIYFPLSQPLQLWKIALLTKTTLEQIGFGTKPGQLEIFPNYTPFIPDYTPRYNGHRLPLQVGSYLLDSDLQIFSSDLTVFIKRWHLVKEGQDYATLQREIDCIKSPRLQATDAGVEEWRDRLETSIKTGWTGKRQTQILSKDTCTYGIVFLSLDWKKLENYVLKTLTNAPGYRQFCGHQRNIERVVRDWIKTNQKSGRYYPLFSRQTERAKPKLGPSNDEKIEKAIRKIQGAIAKISCENGRPPEGNTAIVKCLYKITGCSFSTLYKYRHLWKPQVVESCVMPNEIRNPAEQANIEGKENTQELCVMPRCAKASANCGAVYKANEIQEQQGITVASLLSIYFVRGNLFTHKKTNEVFEFRGYAGSHTGWFRRKYQLTPTVACVFYLTDLEPLAEKTIACCTS